VGIRIVNRDDGGSWLVFTDLTVGLFTLFVLAFVGLATLKHQRDQDLTRSEQEVQSCEEERNKAIQERNALLSSQLKSSVEEGLIVIDEGKINIQASLLFAVGQAAVKPSGKEILQRISSGLVHILDSNHLIMVSGYTDDYPISSATYTNWELSAERATNVVKALIAAGFPQTRLFAAGFGEFHPKVPNTTEENRSINRRVEIAVAPVRVSTFAKQEP
jgi:flagellar motor protein MotB